MLTILCSFIYLSSNVIPPEMASECNWISPEFNIIEEWSLDISDYIDPSATLVGNVYRAETEDGAEWHTILIDQETIFRFEGNALTDSISYPGIIINAIFSPDFRYMLANHHDTENAILFNLEQKTYESISIPLLSSRVCLTDEGQIIAKDLNTLRIYDSDCNLIRFKNDISQNARISLMQPSSIDLIFLASYDSIWAYDFQLNPLWCIERVMRHTFSGYSPVPDFTLSNTGEYIAVRHFIDLDIYCTDSGRLISSFEFPERSFKVRFSESDSILAMPYIDELQNAPGSAAYFGIKEFQLHDGIYEYAGDFMAPNSQTEEGMPSMLDIQSVSDDGFILCNAIYNSGTRMLLLSPELDVIWISDMNPHGGLFFYISSSAMYYCSGYFCCDNRSNFWYFDGNTIHSCIITEN